MTQEKELIVSYDSKADTLYVREKDIKIADSNDDYYNNGIILEINSDDDVCGLIVLCATNKIGRWHLFDDDEDIPTHLYCAVSDWLRTKLNTMISLHKYCSGFIEDCNITCSETIYQMDRVIENAYGFIDGVCDIVGYAESDGE